MKQTFILLLVTVPITLHAQEPILMNSVSEEKIESDAGGEGSIEDTSLPETLEYLARHPLNIHKAGYDEFKNSGLFTETQLQSISDHVRHNGNFIAVEELQQVKGFSEGFIRSILPYIKCNTTALSGKSAVEVIGEGEHYFMYRVQRVIEEKAGYAYGPYSAYKGSPFGSMIRYRYVYRNTISVNLNAEKDPGEEFFTGSNKAGFDFYSASVALTNLNRLKMLVIGDFQVSYGQGLTFASASGGFSGDPVFMKMNYQGIRPYRSVSENGFQRGAALSLRLSSKFTFDAFVSSRNMDGNLRSAEDSLYELNSISSFQTSGYHRTFYEISNKAVFKERLAGSRLSFGSETACIGITGVMVRFNRTIEKTVQPYNRFDFAGNRFARYGFDFWFLKRNAVYFGEIALSEGNALSAVGGVMVSADRFMNFSISGRSYARNYMGLYTAAPGRRSANSNELGVNTAVSLYLTRVWQLTAGLDLYAFPWMVYDADAPSGGKDLNLKLLWTPVRKNEFYIRIRKSSREVTGNEEREIIDRLTLRKRTTIRVHAGYQLSKSVSARTRIEYVSENIGPEKQKGIMFFQDVSFRPLGSRWQISVRYAVFETDSYDTRVYAYENDLPGSYAVPSYYYKGNRYYALLRYKATSALSVWLKYGVFVFTDRDVVGSGYEEIAGNKKSEIRLQIRYEFDQ